MKLLKLVGKKQKVCNQYCVFKVIKIKYIAFKTLEFLLEKLFTKKLIKKTVIHNIPYYFININIAPKALFTVRVINLINIKKIFFKSYFAYIFLNQNIALKSNKSII